MRNCVLDGKHSLVFRLVSNQKHFIILEFEFFDRGIKSDENDPFAGDFLKRKTR